MDPGRFPDDTKKVIFASTFLRGSAFAWYKPYLTDHFTNRTRAKAKTHTIIYSYLEFKKELRLIYSVVNEESAAARQIYQL